MINTLYGDAYTRISGSGSTDVITGIGLYMAKTMIEHNMGGRLTAGNINNGAEFRIEL